MSHTHGNGGSQEESTTTNSAGIMGVQAVTALIRPGHGEKTRPSVPGRTTPLPMPFIVFLALQAAFFSCVAWTRISATGLHKPLPSSADVSVPALRLADSKTMGSGVGPALVEEVLKQLGTAHVPLRNKVNAEEPGVSSTSPDPSQAVIAIRPPGSATSSGGLASADSNVETAHDPGGKTTVEEIHLPPVSEVLGATAGYGGVPPWVVDVPVRMPGEPPRVSSTVTGGQLVHRVTPVYPEQARTQRIQGTVVLEAMVGEDGTVEHITVLSSGPSSLANAARRAVEQWRYTPLELNGKPMTMRNQITIKFTLP